MSKAKGYNTWAEINYHPRANILRNEKPGRLLHQTNKMLHIDTG